MTLATVWFILIAGMLTVYVMLDGFDLGVGILHLYAARTRAERDTVLGTIGPVWDGNEVWLVAAGGTLFMAFPTLYAVSFSGFYLPLIIVLWLFMFRGLAIELRSHVDSRVWATFWDGAFAVSSLLLAVTFGAALGNVVRGVPLTEEGVFFEPLFTNFRIGREVGVLDWYTVLVGAVAAVALTFHGALWLTVRTTGPIRTRATLLGLRLWWLAGLGTVAMSVATFTVQPLIREAVRDRAWGIIFPILAAVGLGGARYCLVRVRPGRAFIASALYLAGMMASAAWSLYPAVLPSRDPEFTLTVQNAAAAPYGLRGGLYWWIPGMLLVVGYFILNYTRMLRVGPVGGAQPNGATAVEHRGYPGWISSR